MSTSDITITVDNQASRFLRDEFGPAKFKSTLKRGMERGLLRVHEQIPEYPEVRTVTQVARGSKLWSKGGAQGQWTEGTVVGIIVSTNRHAGPVDHYQSRRHWRRRKGQDRHQRQ